MTIPNVIRRAKKLEYNLQTATDFKWALRWLVLIAFVFVASQLFAGDPAPANPPNASDPAPAAPPSSRPSQVSNDPAPASPPTAALASDPQPAASPYSLSSADLVKLVDMPSIAAASDPAPAAPPTASLSAKSKPFLGVGFRNPEKPFVTTLYRGSTAAALGVSLGDEIVSLNGMPVSDLESLRSILSEMSIGMNAQVVVGRNEQRLLLGPKPLTRKLQ